MRKRNPLMVMLLRSVCFVVIVLVPQSGDTNSAVIAAVLAAVLWPDYVE